MNISKRLTSTIPWLVLAGVVLAACAGPATPAAPAATSVPVATAASGATSAAAATSAPAAGSVTIRYGLWDANQQPAYQQCADAFHTKFPNITIKLEQSGWDDYWNGVQTGFVSGDAPDVFTDHLAKYPEFAVKQQIMDIDPMVKKDGVDTSIYLPGLADLWVRDGRRYGLPKDWDTIAVFYNQDMLDKAGVDPAIMKTWTWNAQDGGTFEQTIAKLTLDKNGKNGLDPAFDKNNVVQYGFIHQGGGGFSGQTQWSMFAVSNGFKFTDGPWATKYYYDDPKLAETMAWYYSLVKKGYAPPVEAMTGVGGDQFFISGKGALTTEGSWQIGSFVTSSKFKLGFGLLPTGPSGRKSMFNGLADSIYIGTKHPDEAWQWVKYAASPDCANIVGDSGVVFPAQQSGVDRNIATHKAKGLDVTAFTTEGLDPKGTFLFPITDHGAEIGTIMGPVMDSIMLGQSEPAAALKDANTQVNALFK